MPRVETDDDDIKLTHKRPQGKSSFSKKIVGPPPSNIGYMDDAADMTLISSQGTEFKVFAYRLRTFSTVFNSMLGDASFRPSPVVIDATDADLACFLGFMHNPTPAAPKDLEQAKEVINLCDKYDCPLLNPVIKTAIAASLTPVAEKTPWKVLCFASQHDLIDLARAAISLMYHDKVRRHYGPSNFPLADAKQLTLSYLMGYEEQLATQKSRQISEGSTLYKYFDQGGVHKVTIQKAWEEVAREFRPRT